MLHAAKSPSSISWMERLIRRGCPLVRVSTANPSKGVRRVAAPERLDALERLRDDDGDGDMGEANEADLNSQRSTRGRPANVEDFRREHEQRQNLDLRLHNFTKSATAFISVAPEGHAVESEFSLGEDI